MRNLLTLALILISISVFSQWTVRTDTLTYNNGDTLIEKWVGLYTPHPNGLILQIKYHKYFINDGFLILVDEENYKATRRNNDTITDANVTVLWLKDQTFVNRNYVRQWAEWEIEKLLEQQRAIPEQEE